MPRGINLRTLAEPVIGAPAPDKRWRPGKSGLLVLKLALERYRLFDRQIMAAAYENLHPEGLGGTHVADVLPQLAEHGYLRRFERRAQAGQGSLPFVYAPTVQAAQLFEKVEWTPQQLKAVANGSRARASYDHELALSLLRLLWEAGSRPFSDPVGEDYRFQTVVYLGDRSHVFPVVDRRSRHVVVAPDTTILVYQHDADEGRRHYRRVHVELERTRRNALRTVRRFQNYARLLADEDGRVTQWFEHWYRVVPAHATALFIAADPAHQQELIGEARYALGLDEPEDRRRPTQPRVKQVPDLLFGNLQSWFDRIPVTRRNGKQSYDERILSPVSRFFTDQIFVDLHGTPKTVLDLRRSSDPR